MDSYMDGIISGIVPTLLQSSETGVEDVEQSLAHHRGYMMAMAAPSTGADLQCVWDTGCEGVQVKLEDSQ